MQERGGANSVMHAAIRLHEAPATSILCAASNSLSRQEAM